MRVVGITGGVCTGKTTTALIFKELNAHVINADEIAKDLLKPGTQIYKNIILNFKQIITKENNEIDRRLLSKIIFNDKAKRELLNKITHPFIINQLIKEINERINHKLIIVDVPLLIEAGIRALCDVVIVVKSKKEIQIQRIIKKYKVNKSFALKMINAQLPLSLKVKLADFVIDNHKDINYLRTQVFSIYKNLTTLTKL
jgi:dephospho-CoA kinase